jgi:hypothetical protein
MFDTFFIETSQKNDKTKRKYFFALQISELKVSGLADVQISECPDKRIMPDSSIATY